ncbi:replication-relaxation family protein [Streptomyces rishiriensis]|uniref:replication-relaxation family protein n=1 Tax=Streptomyces rishiriensis TaxID=68264 RepID=UPI0027D87F52|nr:replication-relaxation family protein [Streptomyces rishiriensis]
MTRADVDAGAGDRLELAVLVQYRMATTEQMHQIIAPQVRIEQTRRRLAKLRAEGLVDRITLPQAGRRRVWFATAYGVQVAAEWPELRGRRPPRLVSDPVAARQGERSRGAAGTPPSTPRRTRLALPRRPRRPASQQPPPGTSPEATGPDTRQNSQDERTHGAKHRNPGSAAAPTALWSTPCMPNSSRPRRGSG